MNLTNQEKITVDDAERILRQDYRSDVVGVVKHFAESLGTDITNEEQAMDWIHETCDGHQRVIYTFQAQQCLLWSDNDGAYAEDFGEEGMITDGCINWSVLAFATFHRDVQEALELYGVDINSLFDDVDEIVETLESEADHLVFDRDKARETAFDAERKRILEEIEKGGWQ